MSMIITISGTPVSIVEQTPVIHNTLDGRSVATFTVKDLTGLNHYQPGQEILITDTVSGETYTGTINDSDETNLYPNPCIYSAITCVDGHYFADKRYYSGPEYQNTSCGDIATDLLSTVLAAEGITASYASRNDSTPTQWSSGTLSNAVATNNISGGDLELAPAGTSLEVIETGATFNTGTVGNTHVLNGALAQVSFNAIKMVATNSIIDANNTYTYVKIWSGSYVVPATNGFFSYTMYLSNDCPEYKMSLDLVCTDGTTLRDTANEANNGNDQQDMAAHPGNDLTGLANGQWYQRTFGISNCLSGKTIAYVSIACEGDKVGTYTGYFYNAFFSSPTVTTIYGGASSITTQQLQKFGYSSTSVTIAKVYNPVDARISPSYSLNSVKVISDTIISWQSSDTATSSTTPVNYNGTMIYGTGSQTIIKYSIDGGDTFIQCTNNQPLPDLPAGMLVTGLNILFRQELYSASPEIPAYLSEMQCTLETAYNGTIADSHNSFSNNTEWGLGTFSNTTNNSGSVLTLSGVTRNWDNHDISNQTLFGGPGNEMFTKNRTLLIGVDGIGTTGYDGKCRNDFAPQYQNFTAEVDILVGTWDSGIIYRTTNWGNGAGTYAFAALVSPNSVYLARGSNSTSSTNVVPAATTSAGVTLVAGNWHRLKVVVSGTNHKIYLDDTLMVNATDTNFNSTGYCGLIVRNGNATAPTHRQGQFDNFGITPALTGSWVSPSISLNSLATYNMSDLTYRDVSSDPVNTTILAEYTLNNGSTWTTITDSNTDPLTSVNLFQSGNFPGLTVGTSLSGINLKYRFTLTTTSAATFPAMDSVASKIIGGFSGSGSRVSPSLLLNPVGQAGSTLVTWNGIQPANTNIFIDTSLDLVTWTQVGAGATGSAAIAGINTQAEPLVDLFTANTSSSYSSVFFSGGAVATWTFNTSLSRLEASGGTNAALIYNSATAADSNVNVIMDTSDTGGLVWRHVDNTHYYELVIRDSLASSNPNKIQLFKISGSRTQIGSDVVISFTRGDPHVFMVDMIGTAINVTMDGVNILSTSDSTITSPGRNGLRISGGAARFYQLRIQAYGDDVTSKQVFGRVRLTSSDPTVTPQISNLRISCHNASIQAGAIIAKSNYSILNGNKTDIAQIFDDHVKQSGNYWWKIKAGKYTFQKQTSQPAPFCITNKDVLVQNIDIDNINDVYRNSEWITGATDVIALEKSFIGDGVTTTFDLGFSVDTITSITINNVAKNIGIKNADTGKDFYYKQGDSNIVQDTSLIPLNDLQILTVQFNALVDITVNLQSPSEITRMQAIDGTSGIIEFARDGTGKNKASAIQMAYGDLQQYSIAGGKIATFTTLRPGLQVGQLVSMFVSPFGIFDGTFLITDIQISWTSTAVNGVFVLKPWYQVQAIKGPVIGDWTRFIDKLGDN